MNCTDSSIDHKTAYGRIAFSILEDELQVVDAKIKEIDGKILTPLTSLDTPGKTTVTVIILADPVITTIVRCYLLKLLNFTFFILHTPKMAKQIQVCARCLKRNLVTK